MMPGHGPLLAEHMERWALRPKRHPQSQSAGRPPEVAGQVIAPSERPFSCHCLQETL